MTAAFREAEKRRAFSREARATELLRALHTEGWHLVSTPEWSNHDETWHYTVTVDERVISASVFLTDQAVGLFGPEFVTDCRRTLSHDLAAALLKVLER